MIKLFWNTHNQKKSDTKDKEIKEKHERDYVWGVYHKKSSNLWIYEILKKIKYNRNLILQTARSQSNQHMNEIKINLDYLRKFQNG